MYEYAIINFCTSKQKFLNYTTCYVCWYLVRETKMWINLEPELPFQLQAQASHNRIQTYWLPEDRKLALSLPRLYCIKKGLSFSGLAIQCLSCVPLHLKCMSSDIKRKCCKEPLLLLQEPSDFEIFQQKWGMFFSIFQVSFSSQL